jgi:hypothetical protein
MFSRKKMIRCIEVKGHRVAWQQCDRIQNGCIGDSKAIGSMGRFVCEQKRAGSNEERKDIFCLIPF